MSVDKIEQVCKRIIDKYGVHLDTADTVYKEKGSFIADKDIPLQTLFGFDLAHELREYEKEHDNESVNIDLVEVELWLLRLHNEPNNFTVRQAMQAITSKIRKNL